MRGVLAGQTIRRRASTRQLSAAQLTSTPLWTPWEPWSESISEEAPRLPDGLVSYAVCVRVPLTLAARVAACCAAVLAAGLTVPGCGAGQITQTDRQISAVDGAFGDAGTSIALRNVLIPYPHNPAGTYPAGSSVPVLLAIVNQGSGADELIGV